MWLTQSWSAQELLSVLLQGCPSPFLSQSGFWGDSAVMFNESSGHICVLHGDCSLTQQPHLESCSDPPPRKQAFFSPLLITSPMLEDKKEQEWQKTIGTISLGTVGWVCSIQASRTPPLSSRTQERWRVCWGVIQKYPHLQSSRIPVPQSQRKTRRELPCLPSARSTRSFQTFADSSSSSQ